MKSDDRPRLRRPNCIGRPDAVLDRLFSRKIRHICLFELGAPFLARERGQSTILRPLQRRRTPSREVSLSSSVPSSSC